MKDETTTSSHISRRHIGNSILKGPPLEVLTRLRDSDPLRVFEKAAARIRQRFFLLDPSYVFEHSLRRIAASDRRDDITDGWITSKIDEGIEDVLCRDRLEQQGGEPEQGSVDTRYEYLEETFGITYEVARRAAVDFNQLCTWTRECFYAVVINLWSFQVCHERGLGSPEEVVRQVRQAIAAILGVTPFEVDSEQEREHALRQHAAHLLARAGHLVHANYPRLVNRLSDRVTVDTVYRLPQPSSLRLEALTLSRAVQTDATLWKACSLLARVGTTCNSTAREYFELSNDLRPSANSRINLAIDHFGAGESDEARDLLGNVLRVESDPLPVSYAWQNLGMVASAEKDFARAHVAYRNAATTYEKRINPALHWLTTAIQTHSADVQNAAHMVDSMAAEDHPSIADYTECTRRRREAKTWSPSAEDSEAFNAIRNSLGPTSRRAAAIALGS